MQELDWQVAWEIKSFHQCQPYETDEYLVSGLGGA
jgi:hypothetical protein